MNSNLRKNHLLLWVMIAIILPLLTSIAILNIPKYPKQERIEKQIDVSNGQAIKTVREEQVTLILRETSPGYLLELSINNPLKAASALVYKMDKNGGKGALIGQVSEKGAYNFKLQEPIEGILILDKIKNTELMKIQF